MVTVGDWSAFWDEGKLETERGFGSEGEHEMQAEGGGDDDEGVEPAKKKQKGL